MRIGTSTNLIYIRPDGSRVSLIETMRLLKKAGFSSLDFNSYDYTLPGSPLLRDDWEKWIDEIVEEAKCLDISFDQCHGYTYNFLDNSMSADERDRHLELERRSLECISKLGAKVCVMHPSTDFTLDNTMSSFVGNVSYFSDLLERTNHYDFSIALENMMDANINPLKKFGTDLEELLRLVNWFENDRIGVCWDFEHANIMGQDQVVSLKKIGRKLLATHVSDTHSKLDSTLMHVLPMTGTVDWKEAVSTLHSVGYEGVFCLEVHNFMNRLPDCVIDQGLSLAYDVCEYLVSLK